jgi:tRNA threonylcarbamoyladenosine biosynthesis protein TsaE
MKRFLPDEAATIAFGQEVLDALPVDLAGWTLLLHGELGAGKSTFARALIRAAGHSGPVPSPTYTLVEPYSLSRGNIYHVDLYRVSDEEELRYLGWNELENGCRIVEWPDRAPGITEQADLALTLTYEGEGRTADLVGLSDRGKTLVSRLMPQDPANSDSE